MLERDGEIAIVRLHRPDRLNAFTYEMCDRLVEIMDTCEADDTIRAIVLTGSGRAFCAGADLGGGGATFVLEDDPDTGGAPADRGGVVALRFYRSTKPLIVAVNGPAAGVGVTMTLPADVRIAADTARFGFVFTKRGIVPEACSSWFLPRLVGISTALRWTMGGHTVSAGEALEHGLVDEIVPAGDILARAVAIARDMVAETAPVSVALTRQLMWRMLGAPSPEDAHRADSLGVYVRGASADAREGVESFLEKRPAQFPDRLSDGLPVLFPL
nr:enoyl-CoA hydratase-related protein [Rhodococcus sp. HNM0569]